MTTFKFLVQGSAPEPYETTFYSDGKNLSAICTCAAGAQGQYCKHRIDILKGEAVKIVSSKDEIPALLRAFKDSPLDMKLRQLDDELEQQAQIKKKVDATKKEVAKIMFNR